MIFFFQKIKINKFWGKYQGFLGASIPEILVKILISAGFDNALSIADLSDSDINIIQNHAQQNLKELISQSTVYRNTEQFVFLPGHKKTLISLSVKAKEFIEQKKVHEQVQQMELLDVDEIEILKNKLFENTYCESLGLSTKFDEKNLTSSIDAYVSHNSRHSNKKPGYKCTVKCISCVKQIPCTHNSRWETSNLEKHLKIHNEEQQQSSSETLTEKIQQQDKSPNGHVKSTKKALNNAIS